MYRKSKARRKHLLAVAVWAAIVPVLVVWGCGPAAKPLDEAQMSALMEDLMLAHHGALLIQQGAVQAKDSTRARMVQQVLAHHRLSPAEAEAALAAYSEDPEAFERVFNQALERLTVRGAKLKGNYSPQP
ncbi:MAG: hypothetical protein ACK5QE_02145 [Sphingobacteriia bacterium]